MPETVKTKIPDSCFPCCRVEASLHVQERLICDGIKGISKRLVMLCRVLLSVSLIGISLRSPFFVLSSKIKPCLISTLGPG